MEILYLLAGVCLMAFMTYVIRVTPMVVFRSKIKSKWMKSFLYYIPYVVITAMTFPAIFYSTSSMVGASIGCITAILLAYFKRGLLVVAVGASTAVLLCSLIGI